MEKYSNPFGKGGAGAPNRDFNGKVITTRKPGAQPASYQPEPSYSSQPQSYAPYQPPQNFAQYQPPMKPSVQFQQPPQIMPIEQPYQPPYQPQYQSPYIPPVDSYSSYPAENPYEFQPPVAPHGQNGPPHPYNPYGRVPTAPSQPQSYIPADYYSNQPNGHGVNVSMDVQPRNDRFAPSAAKRLMTPNRIAASAIDVGGNEDFAKVRKNQIKNEWQKDLLEQMELKKRAKEEEKRKRDMEEFEEEKRVQREREQMEKEFKMEQNKKKKEFEDMQKANEALLEAHRRKTEGGKKAKRDVEVEQKPPSRQRNMREDLFGREQDIPNTGSNVQIRDGGQQQNLGKTKMIQEIQQQIKVNFDEEISKLRSEIDSRQKQMKNQMESLKSEAERALKERNEAQEQLK